MTPKEHVRVFSCIAEQWLLCLSPPSPGYRSILNMCNSLKWDSQFRLHSRLVKCELWFPLNPHFSAVSFTGPKVHWEGQLPTSGVLGDDHKFLLPCPAPLLLAVPQFCLNSGYSWYSTSLGMCVCVLWSRKELETRAWWRVYPSPPPWYCLHFFTGHPQSVSEGRWPEWVSEAIELVLCFPNNMWWRASLFFIFSNPLWT